MPRTYKKRSPAGSTVGLGELTAATEALIRENVRLKKQLEKAAAGTSLKPVMTAIERLHGRLAKALATGGAAAETAAAPKRKRRPITDPEMLQRRREAMAKARAARTAKRTSSS